MEIQMEKNRKTVTQIAYYSFYLGVIIEVLLVLIDKSAYTNPVEGRMFQLTFLLFGLKVLFTKYSAKEWLIIFLFALLGAVSYFSTGRNEIIRIVIFIAACKDIDMKKCLKLVFFLTLSGSITIMLLSLTGLYGTVSLTQDYGRGSVETRYTLGMGHPNALQCMIWALTVLGLYLYGDRMKWYCYILIMVINFAFFMLSDSKTSLAVVMFSIFMAWVVKLKNKWIHFTIYVWGNIIMVGSIIFSVYVAARAIELWEFTWHAKWNPQIEILRKLDNLLTGRIYSLVGTTNFEGTIATWSLFSKPENNYYFDLGWVRLFYWYGMVPACIFIAVLGILIVYCIKKKEYLGFVMIISFGVYTLVEAHGISVYLARNYVFFLIGAYWNKMFYLQNGKEEYIWKSYQLIKK